MLNSTRADVELQRFPWPCGTPASFTGGEFDVSSQTQRAPSTYFSSRVRELAPSPTLAVSESARQLKAQGIDVIDLGGGDPDFITPEHIRAAAANAMNAGDTHYVASAGILGLRQAIADKLLADNGIEVDPNGGVIVTPGGKQALFEAALAFVEPGVDVLIPEPAWVSYSPMVELAGGTSIPVALDPDDNWRLSLERLSDAWTPASRILLVNSPNNPTGRVLDRSELAAIAEFAQERDLLIFSDEMYEKILYDGQRHTSIATLPGMAERTLIFNGFSKAYAMTGWRLGYVAGPRPYLQQIEKVHSHSVTCATSFVQQAGIVALTGPQAFIGELVSAWDHRRRDLAAALNAIAGIHCPLVEGAFYAFVDIRGTGMSSTAAAELFLREAHVAVTPGIAFGAAGDGHVRLSFAASDALLEEAAARMGQVLGSKPA
ncbi:MAG: pyridoxal phosphate-dependent aminotransferase [Chloroflexi bacterium]|nr:pyridoxal phosphate-dependent aminotransferase [Chloroflexota bacterium]